MIRYLSKAIQSFLPIVLVLLTIFIVILTVEFKATMAANEVHIIHIVQQDKSVESDDEIEDETETQLDTNPLYLKAKEALANNDYNLTKKLYRKLIVDYPSAKLYNRLGVVYYKQQNYKKALQSYANALRHDKRYYRAYYNRALLYSRNDLLDKAIEDYKRAILYHPYHFNSYVNLAAVYAKLDDHENSINIYTKAIPLSSGKKRANIFLRLGKLYISKDLVKAKAYLLQAVRLQPNSLKARLALATMEPDSKLQEKELLRLIELHPLKWEPVYELGRIYETQKAYTQAIQMYESYLQIVPNDSEALFELAGIYTLVKKYKEALSLYEQLEQIQPSSMSVQLKILTLYIKSKRFSEALEKSRLILKTVPQDKKTLMAQADIYEAMLKPDLYYKALKKVLTHYPKDGHALSRMAEYFAMVKKYDKAHRWIDKAIALDLHEYRYWYIKAKIYEQMQALHNAVGMYEKVLTFKKDHKRSLFAVSKILYDLKSYDKALSYALKADQLDPNDEHIQYLIVKIYMTQKKYEEAENRVEKALVEHKKSYKLLRQKALIRSKTHRNESAAKIFGELVDQKPSSASLRYLYARSLKKSKQYEKALKEIKKALQLRENFQKALKLKKQIEYKLKGE